MMFCIQISHRERIQHMIRAYKCSNVYNCVVHSRYTIQFIALLPPQSAMINQFTRLLISIIIVYLIKLTCSQVYICTLYYIAYKINYLGILTHIPSNTRMCTITSFVPVDLHVYVCIYDTALLYVRLIKQQFIL